MNNNNRLELEDFEDLAHDAADVARRAWLRVLQSLNALAVTLGGIVIYVHAAYPGIETQLLGALPPKLQAGALLAFGAAVHYATRQAKKAGQ